MLPVLFRGEKHYEPEAWWYLISQTAPGKVKSQGGLPHCIASFLYREFLGTSKTNWPVLQFATKHFRNRMWLESFYMARAGYK